MEPARPRAERQILHGPRAGHLQHDQLHFAIWRTCHRSGTIRLSSLQHALTSGVRFSLRLNARTFCAKFWQRSAEHDGWWVGRHVLMPDHVHFFARPASDARPKAEWVGMWKSVSSRRIAAALAIESPIWQPDYFDRYLRSSESYSDKWQYVEQNPVRVDLVGRMEDWPYHGIINDLMF